MTVPTFTTKTSTRILLFFFISFQQIWSLPTTPKRDADFESVRTRLDRPYQDLEENHPNKYFHESTFHQHYDGRFADRPLKYDEKQSHLSALVQTYLVTMSSIGAETWLMHGTLLGWYWNRRIMPWDSDVDFMIDERSLGVLAGWWNMTMHRFKLPGREGTRGYLLELNPHFEEVELDRDNRIDARWIDTETGLFIDITTLHRNKTASAARSESAAAAAAAEGPAGDEPDAMMVKDNHHYKYDDIYPLRESLFERTPVLVPYAYADILIEEYGDQALSGVEHEHHRYDEELGRWLPQSVVSSSFDGEEVGSGGRAWNG